MRTLIIAMTLGYVSVSAVSAATRPRHNVSRVTSIDSAAVSRATSEAIRPNSSGPAVVRLQILLDRAHFSPGEIDGHYGDNLRIALLGYQNSRKLNVSGAVDEDTWKSLNTDSDQMLVVYTITPEDVNGPFTPVPKEMMAEAQLKSLDYSSAQEELGERFHINPKLLSTLNPGKDLSKAGEEILVPNDTHAAMPVAEHVVVSNSNPAVTAYAVDGTILAQYPATTGSEHDPLPIGNWKVTIVQQNPWFNYSPKLFWDASPKDVRARIAPGPNNPVGVVWIGLSKEHYGIHGTPEPQNIGHTESHGCIRLTNWDAEELSTMVRRGTAVDLEE